MGKKIFGRANFVLVLLAMVMTLSFATNAFAIPASSIVTNLQPDWGAVGGGGVFAGYYGPPDYLAVSPGATGFYLDEQGGVIKAGQGVNPGVGNWDEGLLGFKPNCTIAELASNPLNFDVVNQDGTNPVWMTIEIGDPVDRSANLTYQFIPAPGDESVWHNVDAGAGSWQLMDDASGTGVGPMMTLAEVAAAPAPAPQEVVRVYLRLGMGDSYYAVPNGTVSWVKQLTAGYSRYVFESADYVITASNINAGGTISDLGDTTVANSDGHSYTITADANYHIGDVLVDGISVGPVNTYDFTNLHNNHTIEAVFLPDTRLLTYTAGSNGTISGPADQIVDYGTDGIEVTAVPDEGYHFVGWSDGVLTPTRTDTNVTVDVIVTANFAINTYNLDYTAGANGSITGDVAQVVNHGSDGTAVTAVADAGYHFVDWSDGVATATRTDVNITGDVSVTANFAIDSYILNYDTDGNGTISGTALQTVNYGEDATTVTAVPNTGYRFVKWSDDITTAARTDLNVTGDIAVTALFEPIPKAVDDDVTAYSNFVWVQPLVNDEPGVGDVVGFSQPSHGTVVEGDPGTNTLKYTPNPGYLGTDSFTYTTTAGTTATVNVNVVAAISGPQNVSVVKATENSVKVTWEAPAEVGSGLKGFYVSWRVQGTTDWNDGARVDDAALAEQTVSSLTPGVSYEFKVTAYDTLAIEAASNVVTFDLIGNVPGVVAPPVTIDSGGGADVPLQGVEDGSTITIGTLPTGVTAAETSGTVLHVTFAPEFSGTVIIPFTVTKDGASAIFGATVTVNPGAPYSVTFEPTLLKNTLVKWAGSLNATGYEIYVNGNLAGTVPSTASSFVVSGLFGPNKTIQVVSLGNDGTSSAHVAGTFQVTSAIKLGKIRFLGYSSKLTSGSKKTLTKLANLVIAQGFTSVYVDGYTAKLPNIHGSRAYRKKLSTERAKTVKKFLLAQFSKAGVTVAVDAHGYGAARPVATNLTWSGRYANRRAEIVLK